MSSEYSLTFDNPKAPNVPMPAGLPKAEKAKVPYLSVELRMQMRLALLNLGPAALWPRVWRNPHDYARVWHRDAPSPVVRTWNSDSEFARQRLAGIDPTVIERLDDASDPRLPQPPAQVVRRVLGESSTLADLVAEERAFVCDYRNLDGQPLRDGRHFVAPVALFAWSKRVGERSPRLMPLGIRLGQGASDPTFFPGPGNGWQAAKFFVQVADGVHGDMWSHLVQSHFVATPFVISTMRKLPLGHPIRTVLEPHFQYTLRVNSKFAGFAAQGLYKLLMPFTTAGQNAVIEKAYKAWRFDTHSFVGDLNRRNVSAHPLDYPYRDDAHELWHVVLDYAKALVGHHYADNAAVTGDPALKAWFDDLVGDGRVRGLPAWPWSPDTLTRVLADILMHFGPRHAAIHSPAADYGIFAPNMSGSSRLPAPNDESEAKDIMAYIPGTRFKPLASFMLHYAISEIEWGQFLGYSDGFDRAAAGETDPGRTDTLLDHSTHLRKIADRMTVRLADAEATIRARNAERRRLFDMDYPFLVPSNIPNSIYA